MKHSLNDAQLKIGEERKPPAEEEAIAGIAKPQANIMKAPNTHLRGQHPKGHGCVEAEFTVLSNSPQALQVGVFQYPKTYQALIRFSNGKSVIDDREPDAHGMAIKIFGVEGKKALSGDESDVQDFILLDNEDLIFHNHN